MPELNLANLIVGVLALFVGGGGGGVIVAWRKDRRQAPIDHSAAERARLEVTELIDKLAGQAVERATTQLAAAEARHAADMAARDQQHTREIALLRREFSDQRDDDRRRFTRRIRHLETRMRDAGIEVPAWNDSPDPAAA